MSGHELDPALPYDAKITFFDAHRPALLSGDYRLSQGLHLQAQAGGLSHKTGNQAATQDRFQEFSVAGPRLVLGPEDVHSVFPPDRVSGDFSSYLPHVALRRPTLPWERSAFEHDHAEPPPWLALLVLDPADVAATQVVDVKTALRMLGLTQEAADDTGRDAREQTHIITLDHAVAKRVLPDIQTLKLLSHVRTAEVKTPAPIKTEMSMVVAAHQPKSRQGESVRNIVHLVSLEGRYKSGRKTAVLPQSGPVHLVSLLSWEIYCQAPLHGFKELLEPIAKKDRLKRLGRPAPEDASLDIAARVKSGWTALPHGVRSGENTFSWFHGPLVGDRRTLPGHQMPLPVFNADKLSILDSSTGLLDISYASAWELGRLVIQERPNIARALASWKRADDYFRLANAAQGGAAHLPHSVDAPHEPRISGLHKFFEEDIAALGAVPFRYLIPDHDMLPLESLRFFDVDKNWISALIDGAFSVGRSTTSKLESDATRAKILPKITAQSGFLLRSAAVSGFKGLQFDGYESVIDDTSLPAPSVARLDTVRASRVGPNTLLVLFSGPLRTLDLHLHVQAMHFSLPDSPTKHARGHVDFGALATTFGLTGADVNSAKLARRLVRGVPLVRIVREPLT